MLFLAIWFTFSYLPIAHMVWAGTGYLFGLGAYDFAGGTVVHINAGVAGLVAALMIGKRRGFPTQMMPPHNLALTLIGASLLWVGWFGFNAGSALEAGNSAVLAFLNTFSATAMAVLAWCAGEALHKGKASMLGAASGAVAGLVAITPAAGNVGLMGALVVGSVAGFACLWGVNGLKKVLGADDSLDVFGVHGVGGIVGALLTGVFASASLGGIGYAPGVGMAAQVGTQALAVLVTCAWSGTVTAGALWLVSKATPLRVDAEAETNGLDLALHDERGYNL
jgi:Amt family ammonium transporter